MNAEPLYRWASTDVLAAVVDAELARFVGGGPTKDQALLALAARRELEDRMRRHRWLAMETARKAGATWSEIATAAGMSTADARRLYETTLGRQKAFGYAEAQRADLGVPELKPVFGSRELGDALAGGRDGEQARVVANTQLTHPTLSTSSTYITSSTARPSTTSSFSSSRHVLFNPGQTPLHRGCAGWASPVVVSAR